MVSFSHEKSTVNFIAKQEQSSIKKKKQKSQSKSKTLSHNFENQYEIFGEIERLTQKIAKLLDLIEPSSDLNNLLTDASEFFKKLSQIKV